MDIVLYALTAILYGALGVAAWRSHGYSGDGALLSAAGATPAIPAGMPGTAPAGAAPAPLGQGVAARADRLVLLLALLCHGVLLHMTIFPSHAMVFGFAYALSAMFWLGACIYLIESFFFSLAGLGLMVLPLACGGAVLPLIFGGVQVLPYSAEPLFKLHFVIANIAYGLLTLAALHAVLMLLAERRLHAARGLSGQRQAGAAWLSGWLDSLPPLLTLEKLLFRLIGAGFVMLTLTLGSGIVFSEHLLDRALMFDHKTVFAFLSWAMFGGVLIARRFYGWRGRAALRWVLASFVALLLAYVGSRFVFEVLLHRAVV